MKSLVIAVALLLLLTFPAFASHGGFHPSPDRLPSGDRGWLLPDQNTPLTLPPSRYSPPAQPLWSPYQQPVYPSAPTPRICVPIGDSGGVYCN